VPPKMIQAITALTSSPELRVSMGGETSEKMSQETGIRQGCTLSPFLFTLVLSAIMHDVETRVRAEHPLATTPAMGVLDLEYADDTALIARTAEIATALLRSTETEAGRYGLRLNKEKTCRLAFNSEEVVRFATGEEVPKVENVKYLGALIDQHGRAGPEVKARIQRAYAAFAALRPVWSVRGFDRDLAVRVFNQCVVSGMLYGLHTLHLTPEWERRLDAAQIRCLRRILGIRSTYASTLIGEVPVPNQEVARLAQAKPASVQVQRARFKLLGHLLRRPGDDPQRASTFDRFGFPRVLGGANRVGAPRKLWSKETVTAAAAAWVTVSGGTGAGGRTPGPKKLAALAADRGAWRRWVEGWFKDRGWEDFTRTTRGPVQAD